MKAELTYMIVENSKVIAERLRELVEGIRKVRKILIVHSFVLALDALEKENIDVVLLDINLPDNLPDKSGVELLRYFKNSGHPAIVIMVSNKTNEYYRTICMQLGAHGFFDKTNELEGLKGMLASL